MKVEDIKFKAKSILDEAWVQGDLIHKEDGKIAILRNGFNESEVDPSTVCQFTGLKDCEGNEIWELFDTEQEALIALFEKFKEKVKRKVDFFSKEAKRLGIKQQLLLQ